MNTISSEASRGYLHAPLQEGEQGRLGLKGELWGKLFEQMPDVERARVRNALTNGPTGVDSKDSAKGVLVFQNLRAYEMTHGGLHGGFYQSVRAYLICVNSENKEVRKEASKALVILLSANRVPTKEEIEVAEKEKWSEDKKRLLKYQDYDFLRVLNELLVAANKEVNGDKAKKAIKECLNVLKVHPQGVMFQELINHAEAALDIHHLNDYEAQKRLFDVFDINSSVCVEQSRGDKGVAQVSKVTMAGSVLGELFVIVHKDTLLEPGLKLLNRILKDEDCSPCQFMAWNLLKVVAKPDSKHEAVQAEAQKFMATITGLDRDRYNKCSPEFIATVAASIKV